MCEDDLVLSVPTSTTSGTSYTTTTSSTTSTSHHKEMSNQSSINYIPIELLDEILSYLDPFSELQIAALVSRKWYKSCRKIYRRRRLAFEDRCASGKLKWSLCKNLKGESPQPRWGVSSVYYQGKLYVFGGLFGRTSAFNDLFMMDLSHNQWTRIRTSGDCPSPRGFSSFMMINPTTALAYGGVHLYEIQERSIVYNDTYVINLETYTWKKPEISGDVPVKRVGHSMSVDHERQCLYLFGGFYGCRSEVSEFLLPDIRKLNLTTWRWEKVRVEGKPPLLRHNHAQVLMNKNHLLIMGGRNGSVGDLSDIAVFDFVKRMWICSQEDQAEDLLLRRLWERPLQARWGQSAVFVGEGHVLVFGGYPCVDFDEFCKAFVLDLRTYEWKEIVIRRCDYKSGLEMSARGFHSVSVCVDRIVLFGGEEINGSKSTLRTFGDVMILS